MLHWGMINETTESGLSEINDEWGDENKRENQSTSMTFEHILVNIFSSFSK